MSLIFALLTLVALMLATLALVRSVDTGNLLMGNIAFKQDATASADQATRAAMDWLTTNAAVLNKDGAVGTGYYATNREFGADGATAAAPMDVTGRQLNGTANRQLVDWGQDNKTNDTCKSFESGTFATCDVKPSTATTINGNTTRYVIFRLCSNTGDPLATPPAGQSISCATPLSSGGSTAKKKGCIGGGADCDIKPLDDAGFSPYYRIVVRVLGARNTASFTETIVHF